MRLTAPRATLDDTATTAIVDNRGRTVGGFLSGQAVPESLLSVVSAYFTIYEYGDLRSHLDRIGRMRFLYGDPRGVSSLDPEEAEDKAFRLTDEGNLELTQALGQKPLARACAEWIKRKADIRTITQSNFLHGKMYHITKPARPTPATGEMSALVGSSNFTRRGLALGQNPNLELNLEVRGGADRESLLEWFNELWHDEQLTHDAKQDVLDALERLGKDYSPEFVYYMTLYHVLGDRLAQQEESETLGGRRSPLRFQVPSHRGYPMDQEALIRRLSLSRFFFRRGIVALRGSGPYAPGLATSLFQDSVEAFLRILAETGKVNVGPQVSFDHLIDKVSNPYGSVSEHKAALSRLNKARVGFKHHAVSVSREDAVHFRETVRAFLTEVTADALQLDFERASLISAIGHRRTENRLQEAQAAIEVADYGTALECAATAFSIYLDTRSVHRARGNSHRLWGPPFDYQHGHPLRPFAEWAIAHFEELHKAMDFLGHGLDITAYWRFLELTSGGHSTSANGPTKEDATFCIEFVVDSVLRIGACHTQENPWRTLEQIGQVEAKEDSVVRVYPRDDSEVIRPVSAGEELTVVAGYIDQAEDYVSILQDEEAAYVQMGHLRLLSGKLRDDGWAPD